ncbi:MAG: hypothetical protein ACK5RL_18600 [Acidimicrobiales bacterium]
MQPVSPTEPTDPWPQAQVQRQRRDSAGTVALAIGIVAIVVQVGSSVFTRLAVSGDRDLDEIAAILGLLGAMSAVLALVAIILGAISVNRNGTSRIAGAVGIGIGAATFVPLIVSLAVVAVGA